MSKSAKTISLKVHEKKVKEAYERGCRHGEFFAKQQQLSFRPLAGPAQASTTKPVDTPISQRDFLLQRKLAINGHILATRRKRAVLNQEIAKLDLELVDFQVNLANIDQQLLNMRKQLNAQKLV